MMSALREELTIEHVRLLLSIAVTTYNEKPEGERRQYLKVVAGSLVRTMIDRLARPDVPDTTHWYLPHIWNTEGICTKCGRDLHLTDDPACSDSLQEAISKCRQLGHLWSESHFPYEGQCLRCGEWDLPETEGADPNEGEPRPWQ